MASLLEDLRNDLVCQMCQNHARPGKRQWYRCLKLHQICQDCKVITDDLVEFDRYKCSCGEPISKEYCKMTEKWLSSPGLKFNCGNAKNGCQETHSENALLEHESECIYRFVPCPFKALNNWCKKRVTYQKVIQHYEKRHNILKELKAPVAWNELAMSGRKGFFRPVKISFSNRMFLLCSKTDSLIHYQWVYLLGSPNEAKHFSYTLKFNGLDTITFQGRVASIDESFQTISGKCFAIPHKNFKNQIVDENSNYEYSLNIRNLKEEAKDENYESGISDNDGDDAKL